MLLLTLPEMTAQASSEGSGFTLQEIWEASGFIARSVIVCLVVMMLGSIYVALERSIAFNRSRKQSMGLAAEIVGPLQTGDVTAARVLTDDERFKAAYLTSILKSGLTELEHRFDEHGIDNAYRAVDKAIIEEQGKMRKGMSILATTGSTAPFVGLFGTTFGVIN